MRYRTITITIKKSCGTARFFYYDGDGEPNPKKILYRGWWRYRSTIMVPSPSTPPSPSCGTITIRGMMVPRMVRNANDRNWTTYYIIKQKVRLFIIFIVYCQQLLQQHCSIYYIYIFILHQNNSNLNR